MSRHLLSLLVAIALTLVSSQDKNTVCSRFTELSTSKTICSNEKKETVATCIFDESAGSCNYIAVELKRLDELISLNNPIDFAAELELMEDSFTCNCINGVPDCSTSEWADHDWNVCEAPVTSTTSKTCDGECCVIDDGSGQTYECCELTTNIFGVKKYSCCDDNVGTLANGVNSTCVTSTIVFDDFLNNPNPNPPMVACSVEVDDNECACSVCPSMDEISYDCAIAGREDIFRECPSDILSSLESDVSSASYLIDPHFPVTASPTVSPTQSPTMSPSIVPTDMPSKSPTLAPTVKGTPAPTRTPTSSPTATFVPNCETIFEKIKRNNEGYGDLTCIDYQGAIPGMIYACSVNAILTGDEKDEVGFNIEPEVSVTYPFNRKCYADTPVEKVEFSCLDNVNATYAEFLSYAFEADWYCNNELPIYAYPNYNLLQGPDAYIERTTKFDRSLADQAYYVEFRIVGDNSDIDITGDDNSNSAAYGGRSYLMTVMLLSVALWSM